MKISVVLPENEPSTVYLEGLNGYVNKKCEPQIENNLATFELSLEEFSDCGIIRVVNSITEKKTFYQKVVVETANHREFVSVKCITNPLVYHQIEKRDVLPAGFQEPEDLEITTSYIKNAPEPVLNVAVRQGDKVVSRDLNVSPGTPLQMEIFLDNNSSNIYGLGVNYMQVTDTISQEETIIFNGCSVDPYLFENFVTDDGDFLKAKFRAFKFPDSSYVQFRGTVNVCLDRCKGIECSNGQIGYGRRKREVKSSSDSNKLFEINLTTFIKVDYDENVDKNLKMDLEEKIKQLKLANLARSRNSRAENVFESVQASKSEKNLNSNEDIAKVEETILFTKDVVENSNSILGHSSIVIAASLLLTFIRLL
jgi:hypothetical protein